MEKYLIQGGNKLRGEIAVAGAKNAALKILAASLLSQEPCHMTNVPNIEDIDRLLEILADLGAKIKRQEHQLTIDASGINKNEPKSELVKRLRTSIMLVGPLLARLGEVKMAHPGGCIIGKRPIDMFLSGFRALGAKIVDSPAGDSYTLKAKKLTGAKIILPWISVTVTESLIMTACLAEGQTTIINAAMEPEIPALADYLNSCGAKIKGAGSSVVTITGVKKLSGGQYHTIPDRIEAGSFALMGLLTGSDITVANCHPEHLQTELFMMQKAGGRLDIGSDYIKTKPSRFQGLELRTHEYPGFATDLQAPFTVLLTQAQGQSLIHETIYEGRLFYTDKLNQMGANIIMCDPHRVVVNGPTKLFGKKLESPDLRAGMALVIAGLIAQGQTSIENIYQIERGYENVVARLQTLGAQIEKIKD